ncbi:MAG TPA: hypothetical protein VIU42_12240 [Xanthobacteraceae bacterium]|jgi:hypothetical protein
MTPDLHAALIRIQQRVVEHYNRLLKQNMSDRERIAVREKLAREERVLSELLRDRMAAA